MTPSVPATWGPLAAPKIAAVVSAVVLLAVVVPVALVRGIFAWLWRPSSRTRRRLSR